MPWNNPLPSLTDGGTPTYTQLNQYLENIDWLRSPPKASYEYLGTADFTTSGTTWGTISAGFGTSIVTSGGYVFLLFSGFIENLEIDVRVDGTRMGGTPDTTGTGLARTQFSAEQFCTLPILFTDLSAGTHTFQMEFKQSTASGRIYGSSTPRFHVREL